MRRLELLAPAKNLECGIAAVDHGADAVYIGAERFGARVAAGNSVEDIAKLCRYAHQFQVKVYVTVNTILYDSELQATERLLQELATAGVDAVLVQDMALLTLCGHLPLSLHASTQTDNRSPEKVTWLRQQGFSRVVLARELSVDEVAAIHRAVPDVELEVFVHGALCVSYSGLCYASQCCFGRSANRGECAQFCRMMFDLVDADGHVLRHDAHLLSLKDMCRIDCLEALAEAGATSFKIEGRLKDVAYVKNVTAAYSERLNQIVRRHPDRYCRASLGYCRYSFVPNLKKTFNRGFTDYFSHGRQPDITSFETPKAIGEYVGTVKELRRNSLTVAGTASFANGDGLCFFTSTPLPSKGRGRGGVTQRPGRDEVSPTSRLHGFRVNRVEGNRLFPSCMPEGLRPGIPLYRNSDQNFDRQLSRTTAVRKIPIVISLTPTQEGFCLEAHFPPLTSKVTIDLPHQMAETPQRENIIRQLTKLGNTPYECQSVSVPEDFPFFIPVSQLSAMRRLLVEKLGDIENDRMGIDMNGNRGMDENEKETQAPPPYSSPHLYNIANRVSADFYGTEELTAYELKPTSDAMLMQCRHCLRYSLGYCLKHGGRQPDWREPLFLRLGNGRTFRLEFDCRHCQMNVYDNTR